MKIINWLILTFLLIFGSVWLFNHFNPWVGIGVFSIHAHSTDGSQPMRSAHTWSSLYSIPPNVLQIGDGCLR